MPFYPRYPISSFLNFFHVPYYKEEGESIEKAVDMVKKEIEERGYRISRIEGHRVREVGTRVMQICVDTSIVRI
jgi:hypothetical protein